MSSRPEDFSSDTPPVRPIGTECEYKLQISPDSIITNSDIVGKNAFTRMKIPHNNQFVGEAHGSGKIYPDVGHLEFASQECMGPAAAAREDIIGINTIANIVESSGYRHNGLYRLAGTYIPNGQFSSKTEQILGGATNGYHENYLFPRDFANDKLIDRFMTSVVASRLWAMSGTLQTQGYVMSQKIWGIGGTPVTRQYERMTHPGLKPMIIVRSDNDTIGGFDYCRAEVRASDPVPSLVNRYLNFSMMSLTLRAIEQQKRLGRSRIEKVCLKDPVDAAKRYAGAIGLRAVAPTRNGPSMSALDVQESALELFETLDDKIQLPKDEHLAIPAIRGLIDALRASRPGKAEYTSIARSRIDFAAKHMYIIKGRADTRINARDNIAVHRMLTWDQILPEGPGQQYWKKIEAIDPMAKQVIQLAAEAGQHPRAKMRASIIDGEMKDCRVNDWVVYLNSNNEAKSLGSPCP